MYIINTIPHGKCFVRYSRTRCFCIRNLTRSLRYPRDAETLPVWFENLLLVISTAATFEACVVPCGYRPLFVRGFLCCLLLGNLAVWVTLGEWSWLLSVFVPEWLRAPVILGSYSVRT